MKILWFDSETTGLDARKNDIIQMGGILVVNGKEVERFNIKCQPFSYETIDHEAIAAHGVTVEQMRTYQTPQVAYKELIKLLGRHCNKYDKTDKFYIGGQNANFDKSFLQYFFLKNDDKYFGSWFYHQVLDLMQFTVILKACGRIKPENLKLETICKLCGVKLEQAHDALADVQATRECFVYLTDKFLRTSAEVRV